MLRFLGKVFMDESMFFQAAGGRVERVEAQTRWRDISPTGVMLVDDYAVLWLMRGASRATGRTGCRLWL